MLNKKWSLLTVVVLLMILVLAACSTPEAEVITIVETRVQEVVITVAGEEVVVTQIVEQEVTRVVAEPTAEMEIVPKDLIVCQAQEPTTLYGNGGSMLAMTSILHALRVPFITNLSYGYQAGPGLVKLPSLADGDAEFVVVEVNTGDMVVDTAGDLVELTDADGFTITDAEGNEVVFDGTPVMMEQLVVRFEMAPLMWEDGEAVTADDSVYSFELNADPDTPAGKFTVDRTAEYVALDDSTTQWTAVPGYRDSTYFANFWTPYPRHQLGSYSAAELLEADESSRSPLSFGAFKLEEWIPGEAIIMSRNENYYLAGEGLPHLDSVTYKFIPDTNALMAQLLAGSCDIGTQDGMDVGQAPFLIEAENGGLLKPYFQTGTVFEHIDFNIDPWDRPERGGERTVWFDNVAVRQAMTMCTDRQSMVDNILYGRSEVIHTYIPSVHPLYPEGLTEWAYDVDGANAMLEEAGFVDSDGDGIREHPETGVPFKVTLGTTTGNEMRQQLTQIFKENMLQCGIDIELYYLPSGEWFADGPEGVLFGRRFDLGEFAWLTGVEPSCNLYMTSSITGPIEEGWGGWGNANETGWSNEDFDAACNRALSSLPGTVDYEEGHKDAQRIFSEQVPVIPLFLRLKVAAARPEVMNFGVDPTENSELWNIYEFDLDR